MKISVFGAGYVGLVQSAVLAGVGNHVVCVDVDAEKVARLTQGDIPIFEPGLSPMIIDNVAAGRLRFTNSAEDAVEHADVIFIAVGTPPDEDGSADLRHVLTVARTIGQLATRSKIVVTKSTVPVGTSDKVRSALFEAGAEHGFVHPEFFSVVSNPEFLKEGSAVDDCSSPDRIIIGSADPAAIATMRELYAPFNRNHERVIVMDVRSAELTKYAANCMLATKISFMNEMSNIAERVGADIEQVRLGIGSDPRIGFQFIYPGCGYGGSCFPKDVQALIQTSVRAGAPAGILQAVEDVNARQKQQLLHYIKKHFGEQVAGKTFAVWGLAFKPNTDDMREAPSLVVIQSLLAQGAKLRAYDPEAKESAQRILGAHDALEYCDTPDSCLDGAHALVIHTEWKQFRSPDFSALKEKLADAVIFDGRNMYSPETVEHHGLAYYGIGRGRSVNH